MPNNASTNLGSDSLVLEAIRTYLTALQLPWDPFRSKSGSCPATRRLLPGYGAKRLPDGQRVDTLPSNGRLPLAESGFLLRNLIPRFLQNFTLYIRTQILQLFSRILERILTSILPYISHFDLNFGVT